MSGSELLPVWGYYTLCCTDHLVHVFQNTDSQGFLGRIPSSGMKSLSHRIYTSMTLPDDAKLLSKVVQEQ